MQDPTRGFSSAMPSDLQRLGASSSTLYSGHTRCPPCHALQRPAPARQRLLVQARGRKDSTLEGDVSPAAPKQLASTRPRGTAAAKLPRHGGRAPDSSAPSAEPTLPTMSTQQAGADQTQPSSRRPARRASRPNAKALLQQVYQSPEHRPVGLVLSSSAILGVAVQLTGAGIGPAWLPVLAGGVLGGLYAALNRVGVRRLWRAPKAPLNVVITGGARGIGKALAREFLRSGDHVFITSRTTEGVEAAVASLKEEVGAGIEVSGFACDVGSPGDAERLAAAAKQYLGSVDCWINNAGYSGSFQSLLEASPSQIEQVVRTNLLGALLCTRAAMNVMRDQPSGGHIFNMDGAGADGFATPNYAPYGATKAGIAQLRRTLQYEAAELEARVAVHNMSPGMVLTDLLLDGATAGNKKAFNILAETPETAAAFLVPRARTVIARGQTGAYIRYLTPASALMRFLTAPARMGRFFDHRGQPTYPPERERVLGEHAEHTERLAARAARRTHALGLCYAGSIAASYLLFVANAMHLLQG